MMNYSTELSIKSKDKLSEKIRDDWNEQAA